VSDVPADNSGVDVGAYCRAVEQHLTRVNNGHLVRIVGPAFELVRQWAEDGMPLTVVFNGIDHKAERHAHGLARRPLQIEFCDADVRDVYDNWRRAVGLMPAAIGEAEVAGAEPAAPSNDKPTARRPSLTKHLERVIDRLTALGGQLDRSESFRDRTAVLLAEVVAIRDRARELRGKPRDDLLPALESLDRTLIAAARADLGEDVIVGFRQDAADQLAAYHDRLSPDAWQRAIEATVENLLRERLRLPTITM
jgi:hypothetical protein